MKFTIEKSFMVLKVDPKKIVGVIETFFDDEIKGFTELDETTIKIGENVANFLANEIKVGRIPNTFLPIQSGVGNIANAVLHGIGESKDIPAFEMYTEVIQDSVIGLLQEGQIKFASGSSLTCSKDAMDKVMGNLDFFRDKLVLRPQEISNSPEVVRRIGLIAINTAIECNSPEIPGQSCCGCRLSGSSPKRPYRGLHFCVSLAECPTAGSP